MQDKDADLKCFYFDRYYTDENKVLTFQLKESTRRSEMNVIKDAELKDLNLMMDVAKTTGSEVTLIGEMQKGKFRADMIGLRNSMFAFLHLC